jgi:hypothetical protein
VELTNNYEVIWQNLFLKVIGLYKVVFNDIRAVSVIFNMLVQIVHTNS